VNVAGTVEMLEACRRYRRPMVLASSSSVYGHNPTLPKVESLEPMPASPYAAHKLSAEVTALAYLRTYALPVLALRFFNIYGPYQAPDHAYAAVVPTFIAHALRGEPVSVHGDGSQTRDFTFIDSVVDVLLEAALTRISHDGPVNLAFGTKTSLNELLSLLEIVLGRPIDVRNGPPRTSDVHDSQAAHSRLDAIFPAAAACDLRDGLNQTAEWMKAHLGLATALPMHT
jgi:UDP-glucose 4-epimerase